MSPQLPMAPPSTQPYTLGSDVTSSRSLTGATITAASNGVALPTGTINVNDTSSLASSGWAFVVIDVGFTNIQLIKYTGKTALTLTGCTGGVGTLTTGRPVVQAWINGPLRRQAIISVRYECQTIGDLAYASAIADIGGSRGIRGWGGILVYNQSVKLDIVTSMTVPVDPGGAYSLYPSRAGTGVIQIYSWIEQDF